MLEISSRLNALSLPATLPPEILLEIFLIHAARVQKERLDDIYSDCERAHRVPSYFKWIRVAHVCRYWREVALSSSDFKAFCVYEAFATPDDHRGPFSLPSAFWDQFPHTVIVHQNMDYSCPRCVRDYVDTIAHEYVCEYSESIKSLAIIIETDDFTSDLWDSMRHAAGDTVESLRIGLRGEAWTYHTSEVGSRLTIPDGLFGSCTPRLRSLTTSHVSFSFANSLLCPSLRHLEITAHQGHRPPQDMQDLIFALDNLSFLETLVVEGLPGIGEPFTGEAHLPRLDLLRISSRMEQAAFFLSRLRLPPTASLVIGLDGSTTSNAASPTSTPTSISVPALTEVLTKFLHVAPPRCMSWDIPPRSSLHSDGQSCLRVWAAAYPPVDDLWVSKPDVAPRLTITDKTYHATLAVLGALELPSLTALYVNGPMPSKEAWAGAFVGAPNISLLRVTGRVGFQLGSSLSLEIMDDTDDEGHSPKACALPHLQTIQFVDVPFPPHTKIDWHPFLLDDTGSDGVEFLDNRWGKRGIDVKDFVRGLRRRRELGADPLERIEFIDCRNMKMTHLRPLLREDVAVVFDGAPLEHSYQ
ncbi:hypothetical protein BN946_scf184325.g8 [Trametes cinnabarina]|uniref:F-box domain-containing protein n=1 Tax=Pycnoporus cinnabarinus TaxID=5643 RepID=A0A060SK80_PYCCI|nr:hypothetical protein BN946_scf184325.g8 [Trametes cinnabarina]